MYNKQKEFLIDLDIACGEIINEYKVISFDKLWELLPMKYKLVGIKLKYFFLNLIFTTNN